MTFALEREMTPIVTAWLREQGMLVLPEICLDGACDLVGCSLNDEMVNRRLCRRKDWRPLHQRLIGVELKLDRIGEVFRQAQWNRHHVEESWAALPLEMTRHITRKDIWGFRICGIGLLGVSRHGCQIVRPAEPTDATEAHIAHQVEKFWRARKRLAAMSARQGARAELVTEGRG
ncbi:MAG TPA: hypothetical protein VM537_03355 [Anaerolineae bacterium]|nr:hypothetical protein [Anaerolineae bacterium]